MQESNEVMGKVYFIGAGPGTPDLLTLRAVDILGRADLVLYADSLVSPELKKFLRPKTPFIGTSTVALPEIKAKMITAAREGKLVARVHSGDPALYGATTEQIAALRQAMIPFEIVPGVSSVFAAAATLGVELTVPEVAQSIIFTRVSGRTGMPEKETLNKFASHNTTMAILLGVNRLPEIIRDLHAGGYTLNTPIAVAYRVSWPDEDFVTGTLEDIYPKVRERGWTRQALILVGRALDPALQDGQHVSHLYKATWRHRFRPQGGSPGSLDLAVEASTTTTVLETTLDFTTPNLAELTTSTPSETLSAAGTSGPTVRVKELAIVSLTVGGAVLAQRLRTLLAADLYISTERNPLAFDLDRGRILPHTGEEGNAASQTRQSSTMPDISENYKTFSEGIAKLLSKLWPQYRQIVLIMASGIAVRAIAPLLTNKQEDPAVVVLDEAGKYAIPLLGGHERGANELATKISNLTSGVAALTSASATKQMPAATILGKKQGWRVAPGSNLTQVSAAIVNEQGVACFQEVGSRAAWSTGNLPAKLQFVDSLATTREAQFAAAILISAQSYTIPPNAALYHPPCLSLGIGCSRGTTPEEIARAVDNALALANLSSLAVLNVASVDFKCAEPGLLAFAEQQNWPLLFFSGAELDQIKVPSLSAAAKYVGTRAVAEPAALLAAGPNASLLVSKQVLGQVTVAIALVSADLTLASFAGPSNGPNHLRELASLTQKEV